MPNISISVTDSGGTRVVNTLDGPVTEIIYDVVVTGAKAFSVSLTPTEIGWKFQQLQDNQKELQGEIAKKLSPLNPQDVTTEEAELKNVRQLRLLASVVRALVPGGAL